MAKPRARDATPVRQRWDPRAYAANARFVPELGRPVVALLDPQPGERILDLGCGDGVLSEVLAAGGSAIVGVDASPELIAVARQKGIDARLMDAMELTFAGEFDAVFSNAALHWMPDAAAVVSGVRAALKTGGRFVGEFGGQGNCGAICAALEAALDARGIAAASGNPWYFPAPDEYREVLEAGGFDVTSIERIERPTILPGALSKWLETFAGSFLALVEEGERDQLLSDVSARLEGELRDKDGAWTADYVRLRFAAARAER